MPLQEPTSLVSVVIPTYNRANLFLPRAIKSVLEQTYRHFELIVVDDASSDNTREVVQSFTDHRIRYIRRETRLGQSAARNQGISVAKGDFIAFLDDDDEFHPEKLSKQVQLFNANPRVDVVYSGWWRVDMESPQVRIAKIPDAAGRLPETRFKHTSMLPRWQFNVIPDLLIRRTLLERNPFNEDLRRNENVELMIRLHFGERCTYAFIREPLVTFYNHGGARTGGSRQHGIETFQYIIDHYSTWLKDYPSFMRRCHVSLGFRLIAVPGQNQAGRSHLWKGLKGDPLNYIAWAYLLFSLLPLSIRAHSRGVSPGKSRRQ